MRAWLTVNRVTAEDDEYDRSLQSMVLDGFDTAELAQREALSFTSQWPISWPPDVGSAQRNPIHPMFARDNWTQARILGRVNWAGGFDVRYGRAVDGVGGKFDAQNPKVWDAIQPALRLVSRILLSRHTYIEALSCIYNYRPVDPAKDGRSARQRRSQGGVPYVSVWLDADDPRAPAPYPEMLNLRALPGPFDREAARAACWRILTTNLTFSFHWDGTTHAFCCSPIGVIGTPSEARPPNVRISLSTTLVWPLLMSRVITDNERAAHTFELAKTILHELAHAIVSAQRNLLTSLSASQGILSPAIIASLYQLGNEMFGPPVGMTFPSGDTGFRRLGRHDVFTEDEAMGEDGYNIEKQLWGNRVILLPMTLDRATHLSPIVALSTWPNSHTQPYQQGVGNGQSALPPSSYLRYLTTPRVQSWDEVLAVPFHEYARFFKESWWDSSHQRYGDTSLKLGYDCETSVVPGPIPSVSPIRPLVVKGADWGDITSILGESTFEWLQKTALSLLQENGHTIISTYLTFLMRQAANVKILGNRFDNEELAWYVCHNTYPILL